MDRKEENAPCQSGSFFKYIYMAGYYTKVSLENILEPDIELYDVELEMLDGLSYSEIRKLHHRIVMKGPKVFWRKLRCNNYWYLFNNFQDTPDSTGYKVWPTDRAVHKKRQLLVAVFIANRDNVEINWEFLLAITEKKTPKHVLQPNLDFDNEKKV